MLDQLDSASSESVKAPEDRGKPGDEDDNSEDDGDDDDDENETLEGLPNLNEFEAFVCWKCVEKHKPFFLKLQALADKQLCLDPVVRGQFTSLQARTEYLDTLNKKRKVEEADLLPSSSGSSTKRVKSDTPDSNPHVAADDPSDTAPAPAPTSSSLSSLPFSVFLPTGFRARLLPHLPSDAVLSRFTEQFPFFVSEEPTYEPPPDDDANSSLLDAGAAALNQIPRQQALRGIQAYSMIKARLNDFFKPFAEEGRVVTEGDVVGFFEQVKSERRAS